MAIEDTTSSGLRVYLLATNAPRRGLFRFFPPATRAELWTGLALLVLSLLGAAWVIKCRADALALEGDSVSREGKVLRLWRTPARRGWHYRVAYEYAAPWMADRRPFQNETELPQAYFDRLKESGPIEVQVCRADPTNHQVAGEHPRIFSTATPLFFDLAVLGLLALAGGINLWWWWISHRVSPTGQVLVVKVGT